MDRTEIRRLLPAAQRLFEQLLNSSQALSILFRLEYFSNLEADLIKSHSIDGMETFP